MRLLKKEELSIAKSNDKAKEIAEGLKISRRVDSLRELQVNEEATLEKWRSETIVSISKEIEQGIAERDEILNRIVELKTQLASMLPEMATEREKLSLLRKELEEKELSLKEKEHEINLKEIDIALVLKNSMESEQRAVTHEKIAEDLHRKAKGIEEDASNSLKRAEIIENNAIVAEQTIKESLSLRDNELTLKEKEVLDREELVNYKEKELKVKEIRLVDREKTLERELERIRKNRL